MTGREWIGTFAGALGVDAPSESVIDELLRLAGTAAHSSERIAAPIACFLVAQSGATSIDEIVRAHAIAAAIGASTAPD